jgi:DNA replication protein DnaC
MLTHPTTERLVALGLAGMAKALAEQRDSRVADGLGFEDRLALLVEREAADRETKRLAKRLNAAKLRQDAIVEDFDPTTKRSLDRALFARLASGDWVGRRQDLIVTGKTGTGKSWIACALGHKACRDDRSVGYWRVQKLLDELAVARGDGRLGRLTKTLARFDLLILDDWGLAPLTSAQGRDVLELIDDRHGRRSTILASQLPVKSWHDLIPDPSVADAVLDRLVHTAHRLEIDGETMRDPRNKSSKRGKVDTGSAA